MAQAQSFADPRGFVGFLLDFAGIKRAAYGVVNIDSTGASLPTGTVSDPVNVAAGARAGTTLGTAQVSVTTTATQIIAARTGTGARTITNITGTQQVYIGNAGVTTATGTLLPAAVGASITIPFSGAIFGIAVTAAQTVSVLETY